MADARLVAAVNKAYWIKQQIRGLEEDYNSLLDSLGDLSTGNYSAGDYVLQVTPTVRFDAATAKKNLSTEQFNSILKPTPNSALAKALLDDQYSLVQKTYGVTRKIVPVTDAEDL